MAEGRYFFALWPGAEVRDRLLSLACKLHPERGHLHQPDDLHLTLLFLGQLSADAVSCMEDAATGIRREPFTLRIDRSGLWSRPGILWAGPSETPRSLGGLVDDLRSAFTACGHVPEQRSYRPHVTLYRKASGGAVDAVESPVEWRAESFVLALSGGSAPGSPRYRILKRWPLYPAE